MSDVEIGFRNFDEARKSQKKKQVEFELFGRMWHTRRIPDTMKLDLVGAVGNREKAHELRRCLNSLLVEEEQSQFLDLCTNGVPEKRDEETGEVTQEAMEPLSIPEMDELISWALAEQTGRPTTPSPPSSPSSDSTSG